MAAANLIANDLQVNRTMSAWLYRLDDPQRKRVSAYAQGTENTTIFNRSARGTSIHIPSNPVSGFGTEVEWQEKMVLHIRHPAEYLFYPVAVMIFAVLSWLLYRHGWLAVTFATNGDLLEDHREAARQAMAPLVLVYLVVPILMFLVLLILILVALKGLISFPQLSFQILLGLAVLYPPLLILRTLKADRSRRVFPNRPLAALFLAAGAVVNAIVLALSMGVAAMLVRLMGSA
jgi:cytochrome bd-type quinol oxidase subunit 2